MKNAIKLGHYKKNWHAEHYQVPEAARSYLETAASEQN